MVESQNQTTSESQCHICLKQLSSKQNLKQHLNIHTGEKPYACSFPGCGNSYRHASQLSNHRLQHQQYNPKPKHQFDDFKTFIQLVILAIEGGNNRKFQPPDGPYSRKDAELPPVKAPQLGIKLPGLELFNLEPS